MANKKTVTVNIVSRRPVMNRKIAILFMIAAPVMATTVSFDDGTISEVPDSHTVKIVEKLPPKQVTNVYCDEAQVCPPVPQCPCETVGYGTDAIIITNHCNGTVTVYNLN